MAVEEREGVGDGELACDHAIAAESVETMGDGEMGGE